ncbi:MAG: hypothetical protein KC492_30290, partial [Myxococcales bacterium]|nr:hypothetical protein [Myxococcales bacterium]
MRLPPCLCALVLLVGCSGSDDGAGGAGASGGSAGDGGNAGLGANGGSSSGGSAAGGNSGAGGSAGSSGGSAGAGSSGGSSGASAGGSSAAGSSAGGSSAGGSSGSAGSGGGTNLAVLPSAGCGKTGAATGKLPGQSSSVNGVPRGYDLFVPKAYDETKPIALVFTYHGAGGTANTNQFKFDDFSEAHGGTSIQVAPQGWTTPEWDSNHFVPFNLDTSDWQGSWVADTSAPDAELPAPVALEFRLQLEDLGEVR